MTDAAATTGARSPLRMPVVRVSVDGAAIDPVLVAALASVRVRREASAPAACSLVYEGPVDATALERAARPGAAVVVSVEGAHEPLFTGSVVTVESAFASDGLTVTLRCQDAAHALRAVSRLRSFIEVSVADLAREIAADAGLTVVATDDGPLLPRLMHDGRSALELLTAVTRSAGLWWQVDRAGQALRLFGADGDEGEVSAAYGENLLEAAVTATTLEHRSGWRIHGWDPVTGDVSSGSSDAGPGAPDAQEAVRGGTTTRGAAHLDALARALATDDRSAARTIRALVDGDPSLVPGASLDVRGLSGDASGRFVVLGADHVIDAIGGYTCAVTSAPPEHLRMRDRIDDPSARAAALTVADVLRIDDPSGLGRVRVGMSVFDGLESEWLPVLALGAGASKGLALQPDIGDRVLVAHDPRDPGRGVVLGGIRTSDGGEPGVGVVDGAVGVYGLGLPTGQSVRLASGGDTVAVANRTGSRIEISETGIRVHAAGDLVLEAPGRTLRLQAARIELEQA